MKVRFHPKLLDTLTDYGRGQMLHDASAGATVGVLALPLAMAFAIASGMSPAAGIWTAIVAGFLISLLGGSRVQIGGPTGAFIPIIYAIVVEHGVQNLLVATMLAGAMLVAMGAFRLGSMIRFIPISVVTGFTNGIAVVIFLSQIKDFLGLSIDSLPGDFFGRLSALLGHLDTVHGPTVALSLASLAALLGWNRLGRRIALFRAVPGPLGVLLVTTALTAALTLPVETIGSRFGGIPQGLPAIGLPELVWSDLGKLIAPALTIAMLGAIESLLSARVADNRIDDRHDPNQELLAQGAANLLAPLFGGFAATGAIARTATNIRTGGRTPIAGMIHAGVLLAIVLALGDLDRLGARLQSYPATAWSTLAALALLLVGLQATSEELVFRGYLLPRLAVQLPSTAAVAVSALVFAAAHPSPGLWGGMLVTWFGVVFGVATWRSGSVWPAIGLHVSHNVLQILLAPGVPVGAAEFAAYAGAALLWLGWIEWLRRRRARVQRLRVTDRPSPMP